MAEPLRPTEAEDGASEPPRSTLPPWLLRLFAREYTPESEIERKHRQMIELIWTRSGQGERYYLAMQPTGVAYGAFIKRVTRLICRGAREGWITVRLPAAPTFDDDAYAIVPDDPERFVAELEALFDADVPGERKDTRS